MKGAISRREFLGNAGGALAFTFVPRHVLGGLGYTAPSEKVNVAGIGVGGQGGVDIERINNTGEVNIIALCDVDEKYAGGMFDAYPEAKRYRDYRKMLDEEKGIDGVVVGTPDHTHAIVSMTAIKTGKHVYCEKPLTHTVYEARKLAEAAREHKVATQMGNQGQASEQTRRICEFIQDGAIGPVREVHSWTDRPNNGLFGVYWPQGVERPKDTPAVPSTLDWDIWLGPAPERGYHPAYHPFVWRGWWDFGTGALGDIGCHSLDPVFRALKLGHPSSVHASCSLVNKETYPLASAVHYDFGARGDMPPVKLSWYDGGLKPRRPDEMDEGLQLPDTGTLYIGDKGKMLNGRLIPESLMREYKYPPKTLPRSPGHYKEWIDACKGGKPGGSNFNWAGPLAEAVLLGNVALRVELREKLSRMKLYWDPEKMEFTNMPEANEFLHYEYRQGWSL